MKMFNRIAFVSVTLGLFILAYSFYQLRAAAEDMRLAQEIQRLKADSDQKLAQINLTLQLDEAILQSLEEKQKPVVPQNPEKCLADNIYYEAAREPYEGQLAVAQVTINRANENPRNICNVVYFKKVNPNTGKKEAAFSWTLGSKWRGRGFNRNLYKECSQIAKAVLTKHLRSDMIDSSVKFYHGDYIHPAWADTREEVVKIGAHIFYR